MGCHWGDTWQGAGWGTATMQTDTMCLCSGNGMSRLSQKSSGIFTLLQLHSISPRNPERCCLRHLRQTLQEHTSETHGPLAESGRCLSEFTAEPWGGTVRGPGLAYERVWAVSYLLFYPKIYLAEKERTDAAQKNLWDTLTMGICEPEWNSWILVDSGISHQLISYKRYNNLVRKFVVVSAMWMGGGWLESRWTLSCLWSIILWT